MEYNLIRYFEQHFESKAINAIYIGLYYYRIVFDDNDDRYARISLHKPLIIVYERNRKWNRFKNILTDVSPTKLVE